jgi:uncharacterized membrane protein YidH (DUF202 family)
VIPRGHLRTKDSDTLAETMETTEGICMRDFALHPRKDDVAGRDQEVHELEDEAVNEVDKPGSFWSKSIRLIIHENECRDHFALERTYLAYVRTASAFAQVGVAVAQLFRLNTANSGEILPSSLKIGNVMGAATEGIAIVVMLTGSIYFLKQQHALVKGGIISRGWDIVLLAALAFAVSNAQRSK